MNIMKRFIALILLLVLAIGVCSCSSGVPSPLSGDAGEKKLAVIFPGAGYNKDRPLLYHSREILEEEGYEILCIEWEDYVKTRYDQASEILDSINFEEYEDVVFVCKSIGTVIASTYAEKHDLKVRQIWFTPLEEAFDKLSSDTEEGSIIAFIGTKDGISNVSQIRIEAEQMGIELHVYDDCDHAMECADESKTREITDDIMKITHEYILML